MHALEYFAQKFGSSLTDLHVVRVDPIAHSHFQAVLVDVADAVDEWVELPMQASVLASTTDELIYRQVAHRCEAKKVVHFVRR
jgi:hypothetical protein